MAAGGMRALNEGVLLGDCSWKFCWNTYALGVWSHAAQHAYSAGLNVTTFTNERDYSSYALVASQRKQSCNRDWNDDNDLGVLELV